MSQSFGRIPVSVVLETEVDRVREDYVINRFVGVLGNGTGAHRMPKFSAVDFVLTRGGHAVAGVELKVRKETVEQVKNYGGLILKHRKMSDLLLFADITKMHTYVAFAFDNGLGPILITQPHLLTDLTPEAPPRRRNYRGLATDEELVLYLDWDVHLKRLQG